ncbi:EAL domain-containing protein [Phyllobacterium sp. SYP-B3895]|uniref:EAL domain-containing protein n=1 Tax=Phyllobacterium sp. SYP-B3895 TaxID=2663240 RepID=UPI001299A8D4|nr:EAL domain-containing protein [Phyllobacterium sp. SYP-B3895]MRG57817.1 EAL domain-containing protein [Phyllobacterium sp. SYP-B3895]
MSFQALTSVSKDAYSNLDWQIMSSAYEQAAFMLDISDDQKRHSHRLAREVMLLFNNGQREAAEIASLAADRERTIVFNAEVKKSRRRSDRVSVPITGNGVRSGPSNSESQQTQVQRLTATITRMAVQYHGGLTAADKLTAERDLLRAMIDQVPDYLFVKDLDYRFVVVNQAVARIHGYSHPSQLIGKTDVELHPNAVASEFLAVEQAIIKSGSPSIDMEEEVVDAETGAKTWLSTSKVALHDDKNEIIGLVGISRDVTVRKNADRLRDGQTLVLEMIAMNAPLEDVLDRIVRLIEEQLEGVFGSIHLVDSDGGHLKHGAAPSLPAAFTRAIDGIAIGPHSGSCGTSAYRHESVIVADIANDPLWTDFRDLAELHGLRSCWSTPILTHQGTVLGTFAMYSGKVRKPGSLEMRLTKKIVRIAGIAIERKRAEDQISFMAHHDALTGLPNRILLSDRLTQAMLHTALHNPWVSVVFADLDNFKSVNDRLGHTAGDELLQIVASRMVSCVRPIDAVMRLGGDEFVILLVDLPASTDAISVILHKLMAAITEPITVDSHEFHITCSMGVATFPQDGTDAQTLLKNADAAMYQAKNGGRDCFQFFTAEMNTKAHERFAMQDAIRKGIARSEFYLDYQPQVDLRSGRIFAVEALIRWRHPVLGVLSPDHFISLAEETGLIVPLGDWVLNEACRQNKAWQDEGLAQVSVSVNVSARQFQEKDWPSRVIRALEETGLEAEYLELELTESLLMRNVDQAIATMKELQELGLHFAIDDFGTGYSSLSALKSLPVSRLKIDQSFVRNLAQDEDDRSIISAVISLGQRLNMLVIAEGVESEDQLAFLRENGCDEGQGYYFSKPIDPRKIADFLMHQT